MSTSGREERWPPDVCRLRSGRVGGSCWSWLRFRPGTRTGQDRFRPPAHASLGVGRLRPAGPAHRPAGTFFISQIQPLESIVDGYQTAFHAGLLSKLRECYIRLLPDQLSKLLQLLSGVSRWLASAVGLGLERTGLSAEPYQVRHALSRDPEHAGYLCLRPLIGVVGLDYPSPHVYRKWRRHTPLSTGQDTCLNCSSRRIALMAHELSLRRS